MFHNNIGSIYSKLGREDLAIAEYKRVIEGMESSQDQQYNPSITWSNLGATYLEQKNSDSTLYCFKQALNAGKEANNKRGMALAHNSLGNFYTDNAMYEDAISHFDSSLSICRIRVDNRLLTTTLLGKTQVYLKMNELKLAQKLAEQALELSQSMGAVTTIRGASKALVEVYEKQQKGMQALEMHRLYKQMNDSIQNQEAIKQIAQAESRAEFEKQLLIQEQEKKEAARLKAKKVATRNSIQYSGIGIGIFILFGLLFFIGNFSLPNWALELSVFLPFLIFFEFLLVLTDPYVDAFTGGEPLQKLALNALLAGAIFPLHAFFEKLMKKKLLKTRKIAS